jgi:hypothetical protein
VNNFTHYHTSDPAMAHDRACRPYGDNPCGFPNCDCPAAKITRTLCTQLVAAAAGMDEEEKLELMGEF